MRCIKCKSRNLKIRENGPHSELYCAECLTFQKFLKKKQAERFGTIDLKENKK